MPCTLPLTPIQYPRKADSTLRHVLIDFREDGVTPYATVWKHGFREVKV